MQDLDHINRCAWFDYQREKVYLRTSKAVRRACLKARKRGKRAKLPVNKEVEIKSRTCPNCGGKQITRLSNETHSKLAYDLKFTAGGIRRQVIRCTAARLKSVLNTRRPSAFRRCSPMGPPGASYVPTVSSPNGEHSTAKGRSLGDFKRERG